MSVPGMDTRGRGGQGRSGRREQLDCDAVSQRPEPALGCSEPGGPFGNIPGWEEGPGFPTGVNQSLDVGSPGRRCAGRKAALSPGQFPEGDSAEDCQHSRKLGEQLQ